jgi:hypothetical protein
LFLPESGRQPVVVDSKSNVEECVGKALNGRRFLGLCWLNEIDCKKNEHQCFVPDDLANDHQDGEISQDSSMVVLDDGDQINLCSFIVGEIHSPDLLHYEFFL